jgi:glutamate racemase
VLTFALAHVVGSAIHIVDSARTTANMLARELRSQSLLSGRPIASPPKLMATDGPERFARVGSRFLGESFTADQVELVDLGRP